MSSLYIQGLDCFESKGTLAIRAHLLINKLKTCLF